MLPSLADFIATGMGRVLGVEELLLEEHGESRILALSVHGDNTGDLQWATGLDDFGEYIGVQGHVHSTWLARHTDVHCHWTDAEAHLMWMVLPLGR